MKEIFEIMSYFPDRLKFCLTDIELSKLSEIRVRRDKPLNLVFTDKSIFLNCIVTREEMDYIFKSICEYSIHSFEKDINSGFITLKGGHRVGICGIKTGGFISEVTSFNFRIARCVLNASGEFTDFLYKDSLPSLIVFGAPNCGKTTFLRDVIKKLSDKKIKVSVIDERREFGENLGNCTDVFSGYQKHDGMQIALRTMSPQIIAIDEIGSVSETEGILMSVNSGVSILASAHAESFEQLKKRPQIKMLFDNLVFDYAVELKAICKVERIIKC